MAVDIFEWEVEQQGFCSCKINAGNFKIEVTEVDIGVNAPYESVSGYRACFELKGDNKTFTLTDDDGNALEAIHYIAIGINAMIEAQRASDE